MMCRRASSPRVSAPGQAASSFLLPKPSRGRAERWTQKLSAATAHTYLAICARPSKNRPRAVFAPAFRTRRINGLQTPSATSAGDLTECEPVALLGPWAVRPRLSHVTLTAFARGPDALSAPTRRASTAATVPSHPAPLRDVRETPSHRCGTAAMILVL